MKKENSSSKEIKLIVPSWLPLGTTLKVAKIDICFIPEEYEMSDCKFDRAEEKDIQEAINRTFFKNNNI